MTESIEQLPSRTLACGGNAHAFVFHHGELAVDEDQVYVVPLPDNDWGAIRPVTHSCFRINHYVSRSMEDVLRKNKRGDSTGLDKNYVDLAKSYAQQPQQPETEILRFLPELKKALAQRALE